MESWRAPELPRLPGRGHPPRLYDTARRQDVTLSPDSVARMYVCGITPYDATHIGHAFTYVAFDLVNRVFRDAGYDVEYVQNVTDVDEPLLERAGRDGEDWQELALRETQRFREDMTALRVLPPAAYVGAVEAIPLIARAVGVLQDRGAVYEIDDDLYFSVQAAPRFGEVAHLTHADMIAASRENGGDPDRPGKKDPLDPLLWRARRPGEPAWDSPLGPGRPGWHIECAAIAQEYLDAQIHVQGGGSDLAFPHHESSAAHAEVASGRAPFAQAYVHTGMVGFEGHKMSKSRGNLVFVSGLREAGVSGSVLRLALLATHYRRDWEWTPSLLADARQRWGRWRTAVAAPAGPDAGPLLETVRARLADDLDTPAALAAVDSWAAAVLDGDPAGLAGAADAAGAPGASDPTAPALVRDLVDALLGIDLPVGE